MIKFCPIARPEVPISFISTRNSAGGARQKIRKPSKKPQQFPEYGKLRSSIAADASVRFLYGGFAPCPQCLSGVRASRPAATALRNAADLILRHQSAEGPLARASADRTSSGSPTAGNDERCHCVAEQIRQRTAFEHEVVDAKDQRHADERGGRDDKERCSQGDESSTGNAICSFRREHGEKKQQHLIAD